MITTHNEKDFISILSGLASNNRKLILGKSLGNNITPIAEIRNMVTAGGSQFALAHINFLNQRASGVYTTDIEQVYLHALYLEDTNSPANTWFTVEDSEHTINSIY